MRNVFFRDDNHDTEHINDRASWRSDDRASWRSDDHASWRSDDHASWRSDDHASCRFDRRHIGKRSLWGIVFAVISLTLTLAQSQAQAADYFVRPGASGDGSGRDWNNAMPSLPSALSRGSVYYLADGSYGAYVFDDPESGTLDITIKKATPDDHGIDTGWIDTYGDGEALFTSATNTIWTFRNGYYQIDGVKGQGKSLKGYGIRLYSTASRCSGPDMVILQGSRTVANVGWKHVEFDYNNGTATCSTNVTALVFASGPTENLTIEKSYFHHSSGFAFYIGPYDPNYGGATERGFTVRDSYFYMNGGGGGESAHWETMWLMNTDDAEIANNVIEDTINAPGQTGWVMIGKSDNMKIHGNLFFCTDSRCIVGGNGVVSTWSHDWCQNSSIHIYNNTFAKLVGVFTPKISFIHNTVQDSDIRVYNNLYSNAKFAWEGVNTQTNEACGGGQSCAGASAQTGIALSQFVNAAGGDFRLAQPTQAGNTVLGAPYGTDLYGKTRGADGVLDRGAYEYGSGGTAPTPAPSILPPSGLRIASATASQVRLQFNASTSTGVSQYAVNRKTGTTGTYSRIGTTSTTSFTDSTVAASTTYCYTVQSMSGSTAVLPASSELCLTVPAATTTTPAAGERLLGTTTPTAVNNNDGVNYELGMKFTSTAAGTIRAIRFYKSPSESGSHTGKIYSSNGTLLASVSFSNESSYGWQEQALPTPLTINANTVYVVSVNTGARYYVATVGGLATQKSTTSLRSVVGTNGVYGTVGAMPTRSWNNTNYFRDVVFVPSP